MQNTVVSWYGLRCYVFITGDHSFPWQIFPNSAGQCSKFCGSPRQIFRIYTVSIKNNADKFDISLYNLQSAGSMSGFFNSGVINADLNGVTVTSTLVFRRSFHSIYHSLTSFHPSMLLGSTESVYFTIRESYQKFFLNIYLRC